MNKLEIAAAFSDAAPTYDQAAFIEQEIGQRLMQRLEYIKINPKYILDLGCGTGYFTRQLQNRYPGATIIGIDIAFGMLKFASASTTLHYCCADAECLPFANQQFDLIFSNCCLPSIKNFEVLFKEINRVLNIDGLLLFTTFGPDTLQELGVTSNWQDMHILGDLLLQYYKNPVVDTEHIIFKYNQLKTLLEDLHNTGGFKIDVTQVANLNNACDVTFEAIYGQAWQQNNVAKQIKDKLGNVYVPLEQLHYL